jgi:hypothetical protein
MKNTLYGQHSSTTSNLYLRELHNAAANLIGDDAAVVKILEKINLQLTTNPNLPTLHLTRLQVYLWLKEKFLW